MLVEAKCCKCGHVVKAPPPKNSFRYIVRCDRCSQEQFFEQIPGMEFFAAIPFSLGTTPAQSIDEYFCKMGFKNTSDYINNDKPVKNYTARCTNCFSPENIERPIRGSIITKFTCKACGHKNVAIENKNSAVHVHSQDGKKANDFVMIGAAIGAVVLQKQKQYGSAVSSAGPILKELYPDGIKPEQYNDLALIVRMLDKISRITKGNGEGDEDSWSDIAGYAILGKANVQNR